jgi:mRNA interferase MazF
MRRGDVRWYAFKAPDKRRPVLVLTRDSALGYLANVTVAPLTTTLRDIPSQVVLTVDSDGVPERCAVSLDNVQTVGKGGLGEVIAHLSPLRMRAVESALCFALGLDEWKASP